MKPKWRIGLIGPGRLGRAMVGELCRRGLPPQALAGRTQEKVVALAQRYGLRFCPMTEIHQTADLILLTVADDALASLATALSRSDGWQGKILLHTSGALDSNVLQPLRDVGARVGSLHPLQSFAGEERIPPGTVFGVEGDQAAKEAAEAIGQFLGGETFALPPGYKALYHAGACIAANFLVTITVLAGELFAAAGLAKEKVPAALLPLVENVVKNMGKLGPAQALTGPVSRGDAQTILRHIKALNDTRPDLLPLYLELSRRTLELAQANGLPAERVKAVEEILVRSNLEME
ncbi:MAG TPA: DUF2520 domain-containing protein [Firmicutes bacterium]|jgi:predicted short-subunit dehydrogenase-like oxidoreductase (DUF2520 family)|nr:DUF2520 domain-containing protein [Bacillota bacterium]HOQ23712.1 DUF2520 domain-containing protein [Bacillota bacterium]HPT68367.1 DUF2520 domain-containing protein [Bacillota bacterium]